jgi:hypothetical protein
MINNEGKRGAITPCSQHTHDKLNMPAENGFEITTKFGYLLKVVVGDLPRLTE